MPIWREWCSPILLVRNWGKEWLWHFLRSDRARTRTLYLPDSSSHAPSSDRSPQWWLPYGPCYIQFQGISEENWAGFLLGVNVPHLHECFLSWKMQVKLTPFINYFAKGKCQHFRYLLKNIPRVDNFNCLILCLRFWYLWWWLDEKVKHLPSQLPPLFLGWHLVANFLIAVLVLLLFLMVIVFQLILRFFKNSIIVIIMKTAIFDIRLIY